VGANDELERDAFDRDAPARSTLCTSRRAPPDAGDSEIAAPCRKGRSSISPIAPATPVRDASSSRIPAAGRYASSTRSAGSFAAARR
jgi:hypothetical protein